MNTLTTLVLLAVVCGTLMPTEGTVIKKRGHYGGQAGHGGTYRTGYVGGAVAGGASAYAGAHASYGASVYRGAGSSGYDYGQRYFDGASSGGSYGYGTGGKKSAPQPAYDYGPGMWYVGNNGCFCTSSGVCPAGVQDRGPCYDCRGNCKSLCCPYPKPTYPKYPKKPYPKKW